jgi:hypothetical protein
VQLRDFREQVGGARCGIPDGLVVDTDQELGAVSADYAHSVNLAASPGVLECVCGSSTKILTSPYSWVPFAGPAKGVLTANSVLVHRLYEDSGTIDWECSAFDLRLTDSAFGPSHRVSPKTHRVHP